MSFYKDKLRRITAYNFEISSKQRKILLLLSFFVTFVALYALNILQPLYTDDWEYSFTFRLYNCAYKGSIPDIHISSIKDIFLSQYEHYFAWGGRCVNHFIAQFLLFIGIPYNKILNSLAYVFFIYLICLFTISKGEKIKLSLYLLVNILIFFFVPVLGSTLLWLTGSANYLWGTLILLMFLLPYKRLYESLSNGENVKLSLFKTFYLFIGGIIAGWTNENMVAASIFMLFVFFLYSRYNKWSLPVWFYTGFTGFVIGFLLMILAPGNYVRYEQTLSEQRAETLPIISVLMNQFVTAVSGIFFYLIPAMTTYFVLLLFLRSWGKKQSHALKLSIVFFATVLVAVLVMTFSPVFPERAWFGIIIFIIITISLIYNELDFNVIFLRNIRSLILVILSVSLIGYYISGYKDLSRASKIYIKREQIIKEQRKNGTMDFVFVHEVKSKSRINNLSDLSNDPAYWANCFYARYYNINTVKIIRPECR